MKALVLAAGKGNRLRPITSLRSKSMLRIAGKPVLEYILDSLKQNGIKDVVIVIGHGREEIVEHFAEGADFGVRIRYVVQLEQKGVEHAMLTAQSEFENETEFLLVNGDVLVESEMVARTLQTHEAMDSDVNMLVTLVSTPEQFGTVKIGRNSLVERLVEKGGPDRYVSNYAVGGVTVFGSEIFERLEKHDTMEKAIETMIADGRKIAATVWEREWAEFTWPWDLLNANHIVLDRQLRGRGTFIAESAEIHKNVVLEGPVFIDEGTIIRPGTTIRGPVYIGKNVYIGNNSLIRDYSSICSDVHIGYSVETRNTMIFDHVNVGRMTYLADSIIGAHSCIEAGVQTWNWRPDRKSFYLKFEDIRVKIPTDKFGAIIGDNVTIGVNVSIYPATRIGENSVIAPGCNLDRDIPPNSFVRVVQKLQITDREKDD